MIPFLASHMFQQQSNWKRSDETETTTKKEYYKLLNFKPMLIKLNVASHGNRFLPQLVNISMIKEIRGGYVDMYGLTPDKWCVGKFIDDSELWIEGSLDELQSKIFDEQDRTLDVRVTNRSGLGPL
jgi:uncharacterized protein YjbJ (UPF0337 family)